MPAKGTVARGPAVLDPGALGSLLQLLAERGYRVIGPAIRGSAVAYQPIDKLDDLPAGRTAAQGPGSCQLAEGPDGALFGYVPGPLSLKNFLHPPQVNLMTTGRENGKFRILPNSEPAPRYAFLGVRACELAAMARQDRVLLQDRHVDEVYRERRSNAFIVAVHCTDPAATCFCASMNTGPRATAGFDIALTELTGQGRHVLIAESGTEAGAAMLAELGSKAAPDELVRAAGQRIDEARERMSRGVAVDGLHDLLYDNLEHPRWDDIATRCLGCGNCTSVCPTCFCTSVEDSTGIPGDTAERWRRWDSCFTQSFSYIHGGSVRLSLKSRYRQWLTHKFAGWIDQFGETGCVGCGRCTTWCPVGIDIVEEIRYFREQAGSTNQQGESHGH